MTENALKRGDEPQFDSRTGHHQHLLTFGLTKPIVGFLFCSEKDPISCHRAIMVAREFDGNNVMVMQ